ncbi:unnamed protein product [Candidula unifasciata]|uniref:Uncharacterized protein n=1 Tax=Candidula unifasciata TaxID=100452 RepID=A0A8S4AE04_9EUPU|nr:unnamed protein product [Candidula unifasciata]
MIVAQKVIRKTSWCPASEKFKNSTVPIIDMRALRFDPTKIQKTEMMADENETPPQLKVATAFLRNQTQTGNKLHKTSTVEVSQNKHIVNERSVVQEDKSDTVKKAGKIDVRKKPATQPAAERLNHVNKKPVTQPAAERLNNVNKKPVTLPAAERLSNVNKKPVTLPAAERLNNVNKKPATLLAAERLNNVNKKPVTLPAAERLNNVNKKPVTLPAAERLNNVNKKPVTLPAAERLNKKPVTLPATERLNKKPVTLSAAERLNNVQMKPVRGSVVKSVGSKTKIHMTSSLVGLFKKKKLDTVYHEESTPFSLQQFFDQQLVTGKNEDNKRFNSNKGSERVDARDVGAQPLETLADVRPALLKTYTQELKETIKSERKHGEFKQGKFLAKTGRHQNKR